MDMNKKEAGFGLYLKTVVAEVYVAMCSRVKGMIGRKVGIVENILNSIPH